MSSVASSTTGRASSNGWLTSRPLWARSATSWVIRLVKAVAALARSIAFLNFAVAISSIVRVILRMLRIDLRRLSRARALAIWCTVDFAHRIHFRWFPMRWAQPTLLAFRKTGFELIDRLRQSRLQLRRQFLLLGNLAANLWLEVL